MATTQVGADVSNQQVNVNNIVPAEDDKLDPSTKRKLIAIGIVAGIIIIIVIIIAALIEYKEIDVYDWCEWCGDNNLQVEYDGNVYYACGTRYDCDRSPFMFYTTDAAGCFYNLNDDNCAELCGSEPYNDWDIKNAFYIPSTGECYCYSHTQYDRVHSWNWDWDEYCFNTSNSVEKYSIYGYQIYDGRPYFKDLNINTQSLIADIKEIDCTKYKYFENDKWIQFINQNHSYSDYNILNEWIKRGLSEHASIATFSRFTLELMSIGAPLWIIKLSNKASIDEIKHTQIAFDVVNLFMDSNYKCVIPNAFPQHTIDIHGDWNKISKDTIIGGCFGETISALTIMNKYKYNNIIDEYLYEIAMDEINHSALAWVTIKWMLNNHIQSIDIENREWWDEQLYTKSQKVQNQREKDIYTRIIPYIVDKLWLDMEYKEFYDMIVEKLRYEIKKVNNAQCVI